MRKLIIILLILCLFPLPVRADFYSIERATWAETKAKLKRTDAFLRTENGKTLVCAGVLAGIWVWKVIYRGPKYYKFNTRTKHFVPYKNK